MRLTNLKTTQLPVIMNIHVALLLNNNMQYCFKVEDLVCIKNLGIICSQISSYTNYNYENTEVSQVQTSRHFPSNSTYNSFPQLSECAKGQEAPSLIT